MNFEELKSRELPDLRKLAAQYGIPTHHRQKAETIAKMIVEHLMNKPKEDPMKHPAEQPDKPPTHICTEDEVRAACAKSLEKTGFTITFPGDETVIFKCRGAEESIHLSTVLRVIKSKAEGVSLGARNLRGFNDKPTNSTPNSGIVMMV